MSRTSLPVCSSSSRCICVREHVCACESARLCVCEYVWKVCVVYVVVHVFVWVSVGFSIYLSVSLFLSVDRSLSVIFVCCFCARRHFLVIFISLARAHILRQHWRCVINVCTNTHTPSIFIRTVKSSRKI